MRLIGVRSLLECDEALTNARSPRMLTRRPWFPSLLRCGTRPSSQAVVLILHSLFVAGLRNLHLPRMSRGKSSKTWSPRRRRRCSRRSQRRGTRRGSASSQTESPALNGRRTYASCELARGWSNYRPTSPGTSAEWLSSPVTSRRPILAATPCHGQTGGLYLGTL